MPDRKPRARATASPAKEAPQQQAAGADGERPLTKREIQFNECKAEGNRFMKIQDYDNALRVYNECIKLAPKDPEVKGAIYSNRSLANVSSSSANTRAPPVLTAV
jgi:hypothetical protein